MEPESKKKRYQKVREQLFELFTATDDSIARMATMASLLHHKMLGFSWTGFYLLRPSPGGTDPELLVGPYQGPLACLKLPAHEGVCWAAIDRGGPVVVPDVHAFPGHIACDPRSRSEVVVPLRDKSGKIVGVLDIDSTRPAHFDDVDAEELSNLVTMIYP